MWFNVSLLSLLFQCAIGATVRHGDPAIVKRHASKIFNAIHSSMRQWGSSWNHNGMSFFLAIVPADTELYHGSPESDPIKGMEWLAFEPEHALVFTGFGWRKRNDTNQGPRPPPPDGGGSEPHRNILQASLEPPNDGDGHGPPPKPPGSSESGFFHTYRTKHDLSLLYIDGISAGKCRIGTLDSQDYILLDWPEYDGHPMFREQERARGLCKIAEEKWHRRVDGFIRMEMGFEMILCDFEKDLNFVEAVRAQPRPETPSPGLPIQDQTWRWYQAIAERFDGIGTNRVTLNYDDFVTAYAYDVNLFPDGPGTVPRLSNLSTHDLHMIRKDVDDMVLRNSHPPHHGGRPPPPRPPPSHGPLPPRPPPPTHHHHNPPDRPTTNWQAIADIIVTRYSNQLPHLAAIDNLTTLHEEVKLLMRPFIDFSNRSIPTEIFRCTRHFMPVDPKKHDHDHRPKHRDASPRPPSLDNPIDLAFDSPSTSLYETLLSYFKPIHPKTPHPHHHPHITGPASLAIQHTSHKICSTLLSTLAPKTTLSQAHTAITDLITQLDWTVWRACPDKCRVDQVCFIPVWPLGSQAVRDTGHGVCLDRSGLKNVGGGYWSPEGGRRGEKPGELFGLYDAGWESG